MKYHSYLKNFVSFLEDNKIYSFSDYSNTNTTYLEKEFIKTGKNEQTFDKYMRAANYYMDFENSKGITMPTTDNKQGKSKTDLSLNQILYGPPGTGKTYTSVAKAIEIIEERKVDISENRNDLKNKILM